MASSGKIWIFAGVGAALLVGAVLGTAVYCRRRRQRKIKDSTVLEGEPEYIDGLQLLD